jgi:hypothetical protein
MPISVIMVVINTSALRYEGVEAYKKVLPFLDCARYDIMIMGAFPFHSFILRYLLRFARSGS